MARICVFNSNKQLDSAGADFKGLRIQTATGASPVRTKPVRVTPSGKDQTRVVTWEFLWNSGAYIQTGILPVQFNNNDANTPSNLQIDFFQEFYLDRLELGAPPSDRPFRVVPKVYDNRGAGPTAGGDGGFGGGGTGKLRGAVFPWAREVTEEVSSTLSDLTSRGVSNERLINHYPIVRRATLPANNPTNEVAENASAFTTPLTVHGLWVRLAFWVSGDQPNGAFAQYNEFATGFTQATDQLMIYAHVGGYSEEGYLDEHEEEPYAHNA